RKCRATPSPPLPSRGPARLSTRRAGALAGGPSGPPPHLDPPRPPDLLCADDPVSLRSPRGLLEVGRDAQIDRRQAQILVEDRLGLATLAPPVAVQKVVLGHNSHERFDVARGQAAPHELHAAGVLG